MLRRIYRRCAGDVLRCKMPVQPALGYSVLMSDQPHRSKGCAARMREYPAPCRMISVQPTLHQAVSAERCTERCCDGQPKSCAGHHESCTIIAYFSGTCKSRCRFPPPFSAAFDRPHRSPMGPFTVGFHRRFPWTATLSGLLPLFSVGRFQPPSPSPDWDFRRFPLCGPLSRTAAEIFTGFLGATRVLWKLPRRRLPHFWGACAFYLLSMVSLHTKTSFLTKPHGSKLSLSSFYGLSHGTGQPLP